MYHHVKDMDSHQLRNGDVDAVDHILLQPKNRHEAQYKCTPLQLRMYQRNRLLYTTPAFTGPPGIIMFAFLIY